MSHALLKHSQPPAGRSVVLADIDWRTYSRLLRLFAERPGIRLTYDRGRLEIMSPRLDHDEAARFLLSLVLIMTEELGLPYKAGGSTTLRRQLRKRGIEADECFWIANAPRMQGKRRLNLRTDPPPDLAIEVDVTHSSLDRLAIYAALGVPEVWHLDGANLVFHVLGTTNYVAAPSSRAFPLVTPADLVGFLQQARQSGDQMPVLRDFRNWVRQKQHSPPQP